MTLIFINTIFLLKKNRFPVHVNITHTIQPKYLKSFLTALGAPIVQWLPSIAEAGPLMPVWDSIPQIYTILVYVCVRSAWLREVEAGMVRSGACHSFVCIFCCCSFQLNSIWTAPKRVQLKNHNN